MLKSELKAHIASKMTHVSEKMIDKGIGLIVAAMTDALLSHQSIEIRNFGAFTLRKMPPRQTHNPATGEKLITGSGYKLHFKAGKGLRERVNTAYLGEKPAPSE